MKCLKRILIISFALCLTMFNYAYANQWDWNSAAGKHNQSLLLVNGELASSDSYYRYGRGDYLAEGSVQITNNQDGTLGISAQTLAHRNVDRIIHSIFIDVWDAERNDWVNLDYWDFEKTKEEQSNGELYMLLTSFTLSGYEVNRYYRLRGLHGVELYDELEACATETDGVKLTDWRN